MTGDLKEFDLLDVVHMVDGDTFDALVRDNDVGTIDGWKLKGEKVIRIRLIHVNTPEFKDDPEAAEDARGDLEDWLHGWFADHPRVLAQTKKDSFGRYLADVYDPGNRSDTASQFMLTEANDGEGWPAFVK